MIIKTNEKSNKNLIRSQFSCKHKFKCPRNDNIRLTMAPLKNCELDIIYLMFKNHYF